MVSPDELREHYASALNPAFHSALAVIRDICVFCDILSPFDYDPRAPRADLDLARAEGRREVGLYILDQIGHDSLRTLALIINEEQKPNDRPSSDADDAEYTG